ncbi:MAG TPA: hypothetical protein DCS30_06890 [Rhizobiales bacterium]|nr:hypothetical protein [Hyphomicrobiales bacterium]
MRSAKSPFFCVLIVSIDSDGSAGHRSCQPRYGEAGSKAPTQRALQTSDRSWRDRWPATSNIQAWENAAFSTRILQAQGIQRVLLVTNAWHIQRARWSFEQFGFEVISAPVGFLSGPNGRPLNGWLPEGKAMWQNTALLNEAIGAVLYRFTYQPPH